jgi:hypothetical protein
MCRRMAQYKELVTRYFKVRPRERHCVAALAPRQCAPPSKAPPSLCTHAMIPGTLLQELGHTHCTFAVQAYWRSPPYNTTRLILAVICGLIIGSFYWSLGDRYGSRPDVQNIIGASASPPPAAFVQLLRIQWHIQAEDLQCRSFASDALASRVNCLLRHCPHCRAVRAATSTTGVQSSSASHSLGLSTSR